MPTPFPDTLTAAGTYPIVEGPLQPRSYAAAGRPDPADPRLPAGTTIRNSDTGNLEYTNGAAWVPLVAGATSVTIYGTAGQVNVSGGAPLALGGTATISLPNVGPGAGTIGGGPNQSIASITIDDQGRVVDATAAVTGAVTSVSNADGSLTVSPTTGDVVASLNVAHANVWTSAQTVRLDDGGTGHVDGLILKNQSAATDEIDQYAPRLHMTGNYWDGAASAQMDGDLVLRTSNGRPTIALMSGSAPLWNVDVATAIAHFHGEVDVGGFLINNVADPLAPQDAATKAYVDASAPTVTLQNAYDGGAAGQQVVALSAANLGVVVRDNATPIGQTLFGIQDSAGSQRYLDVLALSTATRGNLTVDGPNTLGIAQLVVANSVDAAGAFADFRDPTAADGSRNWTIGNAGGTFQALAWNDAVNATVAGFQISASGNTFAIGGQTLTTIQSPSLPFIVAAPNAAPGVNQSAGSLSLRPGQGTGSALGRGVEFWGSVPGASGSAAQTFRQVAQVFVDAAGLVNWSFGTGDSSAPVGPGLIRGSDNNGGNDARGLGLTIRTGLSTGNAASPDILFRYSVPGGSGTTQQSAADAVKVGGSTGLLSALQGFAVTGTTSTAVADFTDGSAAAVSASSRGRLRYNGSTQHWEISENGGAYSQLTSGSTGTFYQTVQAAGAAQAQQPILDFTAEFSIANDDPGTRTKVSVASGGISNAMLANSSLTVAAGTGLSGGGSVSLGGSTTLNLANTAVAAGSYGDASHVGTFDVDAQGRLTAAASVAIAIAASAISGLFYQTIKDGAGASQTQRANLKFASTFSVTDASPDTVVDVASGGISNAMLANSALTVAAGTGLSGGGSVSLGGSVTLSLPSVGPGVATYTWATGDSLALDAQGRVTTVTNVTRTLTAGTGLSGGGTLAADRSFAVVYGSSASTSTQGNDSRLPPAPATLGNLIYDTGSAYAALADVAVGSYLRSGGVAAAPVWSTLTLPNAATTGDVLYASSANVVGRLADVAVNQVLLSGGVGAAPSYGVVPNAALANSSMTVNFASIFSGGGSVSLGGSLTETLNSQSANLFLASPNGSSGTPTFRAIVNADLDTSGATAATYGDSSHVAQVAVNAQGRITSALNVSISATAIGAVTSVGASPPVASSGGQTPTISLNFSTGLTTSGGNLVVDQAFAPTWTGVHVFEKDAIATAQTVEVSVKNATAAANGAQQFSPVLELSGLGFDSTASASKASKWGLQARPVQTAGNPTGDLVFWYSTNAGAYSEVASLKSGGALVVGGSGTVGPSASQQHVLPAVTSDTIALLAATQELTSKTLTAMVVKTGLTASGSAANDFSGSTGTFKTSTGNVTLGSGAITISGAPTFASVATLASGNSSFDLSGGSGIFKTPTGAVTIGTGAVGVSGIATFTAGNTGGASVSITPTAQSSGTPSDLIVTAPANTGMTASTEVSGIRFNQAATGTWATGAITTQREVQINAPTYAFNGASTITTAATVAIDGAPVQGTNATITDALSFWVQAGKSWFEQDAVGTSTALAAVGVNVTNRTAAAAGAQQFSPFFRIQGFGWKTNSTAASQEYSWLFQTRPVQGAASPTGALDVYSSVNNGTPTKYFTLDDTSTITTAANANFTIKSSVTMSGSVTGAITLDTVNTQTSGDKSLSVRSGGTELFRVGLESTVNGVTGLTVAGNTTKGPFFAILASGSGGAAGYTADSSAQTGGRIWTVRAIGNTSGGALAAGDFSILDATGSVNRMIIKTGTALIGDSTTLSSATVTSPGATWGVGAFGVRNTTSPIGLSVFNSEVSTASITVERSGQLELAGHVWNTTATAADNYAVSAIQMVPTSANSPTTQLNFSAYVGTSNTRTYTLYMTWSDTNTFTAQNVTGTKFTQTVQTTGSPNTLTVTGAAHTALTASAEASDVLFSLNRTVQFATGALTTQRAIMSQAPTYGFVGASTLTTAIHRYLDNAPIKGTNATFTNAYNLYLDNVNNIASSGTVTEAASLYVKGAPTSGGTITNAYAIKVAAGNSIFLGDVSLRHLVGNGGAPTISTSPATGIQFGVSPTASIQQGTDTGGVFKLTTGTGTIAFVGGTAVTVAVVAFANAYAATPTAVLIHPADPNSAQAASGATGVEFYVDYSLSDTGHFTIKAIDSGAGTLPASTSFYFSYVVVQ